LSNSDFSSEKTRVDQFWKLKLKALALGKRNRNRRTAKEIRLRISCCKGESWKQHLVVKTGVYWAGWATSKVCNLRNNLKLLKILKYDC